MTPIGPLPDGQDPARSSGYCADAREAKYALPQSRQEQGLRRVRRLTRRKADGSDATSASLVATGQYFLKNLIATAGTSTARGLPLPQLERKTVGSSRHHAISSIDVWGRIADRSCLRTLDWEPLTAIETVLIGDSIAVVPDPATTLTITREGHLRLPAPIRRACHIETGDRLLLTAIPHHSVLLVHTTATLDAMINQHCPWLRTRSGR
jgi:hypothetical protein